jgi:hypothetical protein
MTRFADEERGAREMKRAVAVLAVLMMLAGPLAIAVPQAAGAGEPITIFTQERGSLKPALYACYSLTDLPGGSSGASGGGQGRFCDNGQDGDASADGKVIATPSGECDPCRVTQGLPAKPDSTPPDYLLQPYQDGPSGATFTFRNFLKPSIVVTLQDAKTGKPVKGACIAVGKEGQGGELAACDGDRANGRGDLDGKKNGKIKTARLSTTGNYLVVNTIAPAGYGKAKTIAVSTGPAKTGEFEKATLKLRRLR